MYIGGIDDIDNKLLTLLQVDGRATYSELAKQVGLSRVAVKNRIETMEEIGLITGYSVQIAPKKVDNSIEFMITVEPTPETFDYAIRILSKSRWTTRVQAATGRNVYAFGVVPNRKKLDEYYLQVRKAFSNVSYFSFDIIASTFKDVEGGIEYVESNEKSADLDE